VGPSACFDHQRSADGGRRRGVFHRDQSRHIDGRRGHRNPEPSGSEVGPFLSIEQAMLPQTTPDEDRTKAFSAYNVVGQALGALGSAAAAVPAILGLEALTGYRILMWCYAATGLVLALLFARLSERVEVRRHKKRRRDIGFGRDRGTVLKFAGLYALDSLGSGFVVQSLVFYWFNVRYGIDVKGLGAIAVGTDALAALSFLAAPWVAAHVGLLLAAILPHVIGNVLVMLVPVMPNWPLAVCTWLARYIFAQMERPARQSYTMAIVPEENRSSASGVMAVSRNVAASVAPGISGALLSNPMLGLPFLAAGSIKLIYDGALFLMFRAVRPPEEANRTDPQ
jgi:MFS family permease